MISYYELLGMIKDGNIPKKIKLHMYNTSRIYVAQYDVKEFYGYVIENENDVDNLFKYYLSDNLFESDMFKEDIKIIEDNTIEKISMEIDKFNDSYYDTALIKLANKIDELIDEINKMKGAGYNE